MKDYISDNFFLKTILYLFFLDCFTVRCDGEEDRINSIEQFRNELCKAGGFVKNAVISDQNS